MHQQDVCAVVPTAGIEEAINTQNLQSYLRGHSTGGRQLECSGVVRCLCFNRFDISMIQTVDTAFFDAIHRWWKNNYPMRPTCILKVENETKVVVSCPIMYQRSRSTQSAILLPLKLVVFVGLTHFIHYAIFLLYFPWFVYNVNSFSLGLSTM